LRRAIYEAVAIVLTVAAMVMPSAVMANDSTAELGAGGLAFISNPDVEMRSEDLFISTAPVRVTYRVFHKIDPGITNLVAFPMPDITIDSPDTNIAIPTEDPVNFLAFSTTANGHPVATQAEQKVFAKGVDRTTMLRQLGIPLAPYLGVTSKALDAL